jgi:hypothetical protein
VPANFNFRQRAKNKLFSSPHPFTEG